MSLVQCRYNPNHQMKSSRLLIHEDKCPDRGSKILKVCPYNPVHKVTPFNFEAHKSECPQSPRVDENTEREYREYFKGKNEMTYNSTKITTTERTIISSEDNISQNKLTEKEPNSFGLRDNTRAYKAPERNIIGFFSNNDKQNEKKKRQKDMMHLIDNANFEENGILDYINDINGPRTNQQHGMVNSDEAYDREFMNSIDKQNQDSQLSERMFGQEKEIEIDQDLYYDINKYDPNESDMYIDKKNKNNIYNTMDFDKKEEDFSTSLSSLITKIN